MSQELFMQLLAAIGVVGFIAIVVGIVRNARDYQKLINKEK